MELSQKQITLSEFSAVFFKSILNFEYFEKKRLSSQLLYFRNYGLSKRG